MKEIWRDVVGYEEYYEVSNLGVVKGKDRWAKVGGGGQRFIQGMILKRRTNMNGYQTVTLSQRGCAKNVLVHRIVAEAFIPNPKGLPIINHKDEVRTNNCVDNLEWCDKSYNQLYSLNIHPERAQVFGDNFKDKNTGESLSPWTKPVPHKWFRGILQKTKDGLTVATYENTSDLTKKTKFDSGLITKVCNGRYKTAYGYLWEWV